MLWHLTWTDDLIEALLKSGAGADLYWGSYLRDQEPLSRQSYHLKAPHYDIW